MGAHRAWRGMVRERWSPRESSICAPQVEPGRFRDLRRRRNVAADLRIQFLVDSGRYPSIFDVMRDSHGITGRDGATTTFASVLGRSARITSATLLTARCMSSAIAWLDRPPRAGLSFDCGRGLPSDQSLTVARGVLLITPHPGMAWGFHRRDRLAPWRSWSSTTYGKS